MSNALKHWLTFAVVGTAYSLVCYAHGLTFVNEVQATPNYAYVMLNKYKAENYIDKSGRVMSLHFAVLSYGTYWWASESEVEKSNIMFTPT